MSPFTNAVQKDGFSFKVWRGERMVLLGFDVDKPEDDFVGFAIEVKAPGEGEVYKYLKNRLSFDYKNESQITGDRQFETNVAPIQKFRWIHFPWNIKEGEYCYRATKMHMSDDGELHEGIKLTLCIDLSGVTYDGVVDIGFTRNFASSQAYREEFGNRTDIIPPNGTEGLNFAMKTDVINKFGTNVYDWLGFEAKTLIDSFVDEVVKDETLSLDLMAFDLDLPDFVSKLQTIATGKRLRAVIDDSGSHSAVTCSESLASVQLKNANGDVTRNHFFGLQHHKVMIQRKEGKAVKVLCGSTNFSYRGFFIQANNVLVFNSASVADYFLQMFEQAFASPKAFRHSSLSQSWFVASHQNGPDVHLCFSPHSETRLSLDPIVGAVEQATSSVFYSVAFLSHMATQSTGAALARLMDRPIFSYGTVNQSGKLKLVKPDGTEGLVDFGYLSDKAPEPFKSEWSAGCGINVHHKFVVTDFNLPTARVFTGSSNLAVSGENQNGDHLIMIADPRIATAYTIEALRIFDHLHFRARMTEADQSGHPAAPNVLTLQKPTSLSKQPAWFAKYYEENSQAQRDRLLFGH